MAQEVSVVNIPVVVADGQTIPLVDISTVEGKTYHAFNKTDSLTSRLLGVSYFVAGEDGKRTAERTLSRTNILETLMGLRNAALDDYKQSLLVKDLDKEALTDAAEAPVPVPTKQKRKSIQLFDLEPLQIEAPAVGEVAGVTMSALGKDAASPLYLEVKAENLQYLRGVVEHQLKKDSIKRLSSRKVHEKDGTKVLLEGDGETMDYKRNRVRTVTRVDGKRTSTYKRSPPATPSSSRGERTSSQNEDSQFTVDEEFDQDAKL